MTSSLAERLKTETRTLHTAAERSSFMGALLRGQMEREAYVALLRNLHAIYAALEPALERHAQHPAIAPVFLPALWRLPALAHDLERLHGPGWPHELPLQPATQAYVERLHTLDADEPDLLLAHAYVRYLGDLSGGQMLHAIVGRTLVPEFADAVDFYVFGDAEQTRALTTAFRSGLASVAVGEDRVDALVDEAKSAFERHRQLFAELATAHGLA